MFGRCHNIAANGRRALEWRGVAGQTNLWRLWSDGGAAGGVTVSRIIRGNLGEYLLS
jgi:hypothetical protein